LLAADLFVRVTAAHKKTLAAFAQIVLQGQQTMSRSQQVTASSVSPPASRTRRRSPRILLRCKDRLLAMTPQFAAPLPPAQQREAGEYQGPYYQ
jgi:hypothetical protein